MAQRTAVVLGKHRTQLTTATVEERPRVISVNGVHYEHVSTAGNGNWEYAPSDRRREDGRVISGR